MPLFLEQGAKIVETDGRSLYIFDVQTISGKEGIDQNNVYTKFNQYRVRQPEAGAVLH